MKHQFHNKKTSYQDFKTPKKTHSPHPHPAANRRGRSHEGNSESAPSLPPCLSLSLGKLSYVRSYDKRANSEAASLCVVHFVQSLHPFLKPNSPNTEARSKKRSSPTDTISFQNIHFPLHSRRRETGELCSK